MLVNYDSTVVSISNLIVKCLLDWPLITGCRGEIALEKAGAYSSQWCILNEHLKLLIKILLKLNACKGRNVCKNTKPSLRPGYSLLWS